MTNEQNGIKTDLEPHESFLSVMACRLLQVLKQTQKASLDHYVLRNHTVRYFEQMSSVLCRTTLDIPL